MNQESVLYGNKDTLKIELGYEQKKALVREVYDVDVPCIDIEDLCELDKLFFVMLYYLNFYAKINISERNDLNIERCAWLEHFLANGCIRISPKSDIIAFEDEEFPRYVKLHLAKYLSSVNHDKIGDIKKSNEFFSSECDAYDIVETFKKYVREDLLRKFSLELDTKGIKMDRNIMDIYELDKIMEQYSYTNLLFACKRVAYTLEKKCNEDKETIERAGRTAIRYLCNYSGVFYAKEMPEERATVLLPEVDFFVKKVFRTNKSILKKPITMELINYLNKED